MKRLLKWAVAPVALIAVLAVMSPSEANAQFGISIGSGYNSYGAYGGVPAGYGMMPYQYQYVQPYPVYRPNFVGSWGYPGGTYNYGHHHHRHHHRGW